MASRGNFSISLAVAVAAVLTGPLHAQSITPQDAAALPSMRTTIPMEENPAIGYFELPTTDRVATLIDQIDKGMVDFGAEGPSGFLKGLLAALDVSVESQVLVFSKTSMQRQFIDAKTPRALFFGDDIVVAYIPEAPLIEIAVQDPRQGMVFYTLDQESRRLPLIERRSECAGCHISSASMSVPGALNRSVATREDGTAMPMIANSVVDHRTPAAERWGGHYVTGIAGGDHIGNRALANNSDATEMRPLGAPEQAVDLSGYISAKSEAAALLVLDHQVNMMNLITRIGWDARVGDDYVRQQKIPGGVRDTLIKSDAREFVDYLLFVDEAALPGKVSPSTFADEFAKRGPRDKKGRSLYDLDLSTRLMRYPCSYLIYSAAFDGLPAPAKEAVYARLWDVLAGKDRDRKYSRLSARDRKAIAEILKDTKPGLPAYFK